MSQAINLPNVFVYETKTHKFNIRWTSLGNSDAPPLIFIHGTPWSSAVWRDLAFSLSSRYNVYLYDHPGFGLSPRPRRFVDAADEEKVDLDGSLALRAAASAALFSSWKLNGQPHVVAHDNGGLVSLRLYLEHDIEFASLCLIDVVAIGPYGLPFFKLVAENEAVFKAIPSNFVEGFVRAYVKSATYKSMPQKIEDMLCAPWIANGTQGFNRFLKEMVQAHNRDSQSIETRYSLVGGSIPTKIIWGEEDSWLPSEIASRLEKALNATELVIIEDAGHLIQYDQPGRLAVEVGLWLKEHSEDIL